MDNNSQSFIHIKYSEKNIVCFHLHLFIYEMLIHFVELNFKLTQYCMVSWYYLVSWYFSWYSIVRHFYGIVTTLMCIYMYMFIYGGHTSHRFDFLSALVLPYKYCLPTNFLFVVQAEQNNASCRENIFESQSPSCTVLSGEKREKCYAKEQRMLWENQIDRVQHKF